MKFTIEQIKAEHQKVKSGADFPRYIQAIKDLGFLIIRLTFQIIILIILILKTN
ncbi:hypothetical protein [Chryseobacterium wanjuense]